MSTSEPPRLALIEVLGRDGRLLRSVDVTRWPLTLGRSLEADLVLDDPHVAPLHATLAPDAEGHLTLDVGDTANGVGEGRQRHGRGSRVPVPAGGASWQFGTLTLKLRTPDEALAPEKPLPRAARGGRRSPLAQAALLVALVVAGHWRSLDPGHDATDWIAVLAGLPLALMLWCGLWALGSKLFQHRFEFGAHLRIALPAVLAIELIDAFWPALAATLGFSGLWRLGPPLQLLVLLLLLRRHLLRVLPNLNRAVTSFVAAAGIAFAGVSITGNWHSVDRWSRPPYMSTLPLPALQWSTPEPADALVGDLGPLADELAERVRRAEAEEAQDDGAPGAGSAPASSPGGGARTSGTAGQAR